MENVLNYLKENEVKCKKVEDNLGDFIAIFSYGKLTRKEIVAKMEENNLLCMFFEGFIREAEWKKKKSI